MKDMKIFRDLFAAIMIGMIGGLAVSVISYYQKNKEGGIVQTAFAVLNSFERVAGEYNRENQMVDVDGDGLVKAQSLSDQVADVFGRIEDGDETVLSETGTAAVLAGIGGGSVLSGDNGDLYGGELLAMDGRDGNLQEGEPYDGILRFHVRANSDSAEDQELKMAVKEDVITMLRPLLEKCEDVAQSKSIVVANLQNIYVTAVNTIVEQGYDYDVKVYVTEEEFPIKTYGDLTFPAGNYQALRIDIGAAEGQNWWCVMFPPLCFIDESTAVVSEEGKEALKRALTAEEYEALYAYYSGADKEALSDGGENEIVIKGESWLANWWKQRKTGNAF